MIEQTFKWAGHAHRFAKRANAQKTHDEIIVVQKEHGGSPPEGALLQFAKANPNSELYKLFDWNPEEAAKKWNVHTEKLIQNSIIKVTINKGVEHKVTEIRAFINIKQKVEGKSMRVYRSIDDVLQDPEQREQMVNRAYREFQTFYKRWQDYSEIAAINEKITSFIKSKEN